MFNFVNCRFPNGTFIGMISEVGYGKVDTSIAGFGPNVVRNEIVYFTQGIDRTTTTLIIRTPKKSDQISFIDRKFKIFYHAFSIQNIRTSELMIPNCRVF